MLLLVLFVGIAWILAAGRLSRPTLDSGAKGPSIFLVTFSTNKPHHDKRQENRVFLRGHLANAFLLIMLSSFPFLSYRSRGDFRHTAVPRECSL